MDIGKLLGDLKGNVLDASHFDLLKHAYDLQEQNITQLKSNNAALRESNELIKEKSQRDGEEIELLKQEIQRLSKLVSESGESGKGGPIVLSDNAIKILQKIMREDVTEFYQNAMVETIDLGRIEAEAALDELSEKEIIHASSARRGYGLRYRLTPKGKKELANVLSEA